MPSSNVQFFKGRRQGNYTINNHKKKAYFIQIHDDFHELGTKKLRRGQIWGLGFLKRMEKKK